MTGWPGVRPSRRVAASAYVVAVTAWVVWMAWLPVRLDAGPAGAGTAVAAALTYQAAGLVCHQQPGRSFHSGTWAWPVCARCAGLYAGGALGGFLSLVALSVWLRRRSVTPPRVALGAARVVLVAAALPTALLWGAEWMGGATVSNGWRCVGAVPLGAAVSALVVLALTGVPMTDKPRPSGVH